MVSTGITKDSDRLNPGLCGICTLVEKMSISKQFKLMIISSSEKCHKVNSRQGRFDVCVSVSGIAILDRVVRGVTCLATRD